ncbi:protein of unknown function [Georgfuchsia toluolica]|uniref:Uncharacterized protein n=1 Tax=Georgfuchsia toluolica TaxID=424218 RepID=A0A916J7K6_9PROT|nr:protein of unknown function [Georgfuchsia toluolica]
MIHVNKKRIMRAKKLRLDVTKSHSVKGRLVEKWIVAFLRGWMCYWHRNVPEWAARDI